ncbi:thioredoxin family protein [Pedobacter nutrimenti]|uniref:thioredoxin family protein n=1 Tax=Pedobacter nutrimenti TaxID=1241337 RepID=UPI002931DFB6|nr:thioredoxin family protein [Pedobacter nutrimenti]
MKKYMYIIFAFLLPGFATNSVFAQGIEFNHGTWAEIKALAKAKNKLIFVDFYTDWCGPCKHMSMNVFPQKEAGDFYNQNFIAYKVDAEKGEGPALAKQYHVAGYPTLAYISADGEVVHRLTSSTDVKELIDQGKIALTPQNDYHQLKEKFAKNELDKEELYRYFLVVKAKGDDKETSEVFERYFDAVAAVSPAIFDLISSNINSTDSKAFKYLESHSKDFAARIGKEKVEGYIKNLYMNEFQGKVWYKSYKTLSEYETAKSDLKTKIVLTDKEALSFDTDYYLRAGDEDNYMLYADKLVKKYCYNDDLKISNVIGGGSRLIKKEANILIMKSWAERALVIKDNFINNATLAMLYKQLKNRTLAVKYIDKSIEQCKQEKNGYEDRAQMIKKEIEEASYE